MLTGRVWSVLCQRHVVPKEKPEFPGVLKAEGCGDLSHKDSSSWRSSLGKGPEEESVGFGGKRLCLPSHLADPRAVLLSAGSSAGAVGQMRWGTRGHRSRWRWGRRQVPGVWARLPQASTRTHGSSPGRSLGVTQQEEEELGTGPRPLFFFLIEKKMRAHFIPF